MVGGEIAFPVVSNGWRRILLIGTLGASVGIFVVPMSPLGIGGSILDTDYTDLELGDLAITQGGVHVLVYVGEEKWTQADPGLGLVATLDGRKDYNGWFRVPVAAYRWRILAQAGSGGD